MNAEPVAGSGAGAASGERLLSLDVLRGFTMFWLMGGKPFVMALAALAGSGGWLIAYELDPSVWEGLRYYDLIWPCFMLMVGVAVAFSHGRHTPGQAWRRAAVLFLLGSLRASRDVVLCMRLGRLLFRNGRAVALVQRRLVHRLVVPPVALHGPGYRRKSASAARRNPTRAPDALP
jgi:predicted acyltransferase